MIQFGMMLYGGIGNMCFQIATAEWIGFKYNIDVCYPNIESQLNHLKNNYAWTTHADQYPHIFADIDLFKNKDFTPIGYKKIGFRYDELTPHNGVVYDGYFQSYKNFDNRIIQYMLRPMNGIRYAVDDVLKPYYNIDKTCSIHVRRGNYLQLQDHHVVQPLDYYLKAMDVIKADRYLIFSDDLEWCKQNFIGSQFVFIKDIDYIEMFAMSRCTHNIIANSSFSYWGAMLNPNPDKIVCYPANWFPNNNPDSSDICPPEWIKL